MCSPCPLTHTRTGPACSVALSSCLAAVLRHWTPQHFTGVLASRRDWACSTLQPWRCAGTNLQHGSLDTNAAESCMEEHAALLHNPLPKVPAQHKQFNTDATVTAACCQHLLDASRSTFMCRAQTAQQFVAPFPASLPASAAPCCIWHSEPLACGI